MEAPIADIHNMGDGDGTFADGTGFDAKDRKLLTNPKAIQKFYRAFRKTPHVFEIFFVNSQTLDGSGRDNDLVDDRAMENSAGIHDHVGDIEGKPGVIRHVQMSNLSPTEAKLPMTPWILAHKIAHAVQDGWSFDPIDPHISAINNQLLNIVRVDIGLPSFDNLRHNRDYDFGPNGPAVIVNRLTMKSARTVSLTNEFEVFAEVVAQYLITGRVTMLIKPETQPEVDKLNALIKSMFDSLEGKVLLEV